MLYIYVCKLNNAGQQGLVHINTNERNNECLTPLGTVLLQEVLEML